MPVVSRSRMKAEAAEQPACVQATADVQQTGTQRNVMKFMPGKISCNKYEQRVDNCTKEQLSLLLTSVEYQQWQRARQPTKPHSWKLSPEALFGLILLLVVPSVLLAPYYLSNADQQVALANFPNYEQVPTCFAPGCTCSLLKCCIEIMSLGC